MRDRIFPTLFCAAWIAVVPALSEDAPQSLEPTKNEYRIVSPVPSGSTVTMVEQPPRLDTLQGKTIALVGGSFSASVTHAVIRDMLVEEFGCRIYFMEEIGKGGSYNPANPSAQTTEFQNRLREYGVDAVISGNCGCGICTVKETGNALAAEAIGIPAVVVGAQSFIAQIESTGYSRGIPVVRTAAYEGAFASDDTPTQQYKARYSLYDQVVTALTTLIRQEEIDRIAGAVGSVRYDDVIFTGSFQRVQEFYKVNEMADGLPVVPPTDEKVAHYLAFSGYGAEDCVCERNGEPLSVPPAFRKITAYQVAANAIMAGCPPETMPVCIAITRCLANGDFYKPLQSTHAWTPYVLVNGPIVRELGLSIGNGGINDPANRRIGRFLSLAMLNLAGYKIKENRMGTFGYMMPFAFAEDEQACRDLGWAPYHEAKEFDPDESVVTCGSTMTWGNSVLLCTNDSVRALQSLAWDITEKQQNALGNTNPRVPRLILLTRAAAETLARGHATKDALEDALIAASSRPLWMRTYAHYWANTGSKIHLNRTFDEYYEALKNGEETENVEADIVSSEAAPPWLSPIVPFGRIDCVRTMDKGHTGIVVVGGGTAAEAQIMPGGDCASYRVKLPSNWSDLLASSTASRLPMSTRYADDFNGHYDDLDCAEDDCDCLEPDSNLFKVVSPVNRPNTSNEVVFAGAYDRVQAHFDEAGQTDGLPIVPPTTLKVEKFMRYTPYGDNDVVATVGGIGVTACQVAANAVLAGCSADLLPICIAMVQALEDDAYLREISDGRRVPLVFVNGPVGRQVGVDNGQGMTTEEVNVCLGRFLEMALINFAGVARTRTAPFGSVQPLVFSENDPACREAGWEPFHVQMGYGTNDSTVTMSSFGMWGNNLTPATDWPEEIMKLVAWDITEKNLGGLGAADTETYAATKRIVFVTPPVALALSALYRSKEALEGDLVYHARRPMAMRAFAYYQADTDGVLTAGKTLEEVYGELVATEAEGARITTAPPWLVGITNPKIMTGSALRAGNVRILVTGDASRNKTQVMPGGKCVTVGLELPAAWDALLVELQHKPLSEFALPECDPIVRAPIPVPSALTDGTYRILDPTTGSRYLTRAGRMYFDAASNTLFFYPAGGTGASSTVLDPDEYADFIQYVENLGYNSSFTVSSGAASEAVIRFSSNGKKPGNNTVALTADAFGSLTLHANHTANSNAAGGIAVDGATVLLSSTIRSLDVDLDGSGLVAGESSCAGFVTLEGSRVTLNPDAPAGAKAVFGVPNGDGTYRTLTFANLANGTYEITYGESDTLSLRESNVFLELPTIGVSEAFSKTDTPNTYVLTRRFEAGECRFRISDGGVPYGSADAIADACDRLPLAEREDGCVLQLGAADYYTFTYNGSDHKLTVVRDVAKAGLCSGGTIENIAGVYVIRPDGEDGPIEVSNLPEDASFAVDLNGAVVAGEAFAGLADGASEGPFSLALKPPVIEGCAECAASKASPAAFSVTVRSFANLRYGLWRASALGGTFLPVAVDSAQAVGTGEPLALLDADPSRPEDKAFYKVSVSLPSDAPYGMPGDDGSR